MKYKIQVFLNRIAVPYLDDFEKARQYNLKHGVEIEWTFKNVDVHGYVSEWTPTMSGGRYFLTGAEKLLPLDLNFDVNMFVLDEGEWATPPGSLFPLKPDVPCGSCRLYGKPFIVAPTYQYDHDNGITWVMLAHEVMHSLVQNANQKGLNIPDVMDTYRENQNPDSPTGNFAQQWQLLQPFLAQKYKYFKDTEIVGLKSELVRKLDLAREYAGVPFRITSGLRTQAQNDALRGSVEDSAHLTGLAVDIACPDSATRWKMLQGALKAGFKRIGIGKDFVHLDCDPAKPQECVWTYY